MACRGVHFALRPSDVEKLKAIEDEGQRLNYLIEEIEEEYFESEDELVAESDKSWDALHRLLADGELTWDGGSYPLNHTVLGGDLLYTGDDYIMSLKSPEQVKDISRALVELSEADFRKRYYEINRETYCEELSDEDLEYTWSWFQGVRDLYAKAAANEYYVLFTVDQ
jgi:hypothetical protein